MRSVTSFFDPTIYRKTLTRFWPLWAVNLVFWLFVLPLNGLVALTNYLDGNETAMFRFANNVGDYGCQSAVVVSVILGLVMAMAVCSHLYNNRSANFMAALPIRREGQFISTYLAGLTMLVGPNVIVFLLTLLVEAAGSAVTWPPLLFWLGSLCAMEFFFYSFAVCLAQFTGHILAVPVYYGVFNVIVLAAYSLISEVFRSYYFGFSNAMFDYSPAYWFTPAAALWEVDFDVTALSMDLTPADMARTVYTFETENLWAVVVYAIVGLILAVCALLLYRRRHMETAGDIVSVKIMRPVFKYGVSVCTGLAFGIFTTMMLDLHEGFMMVSIIIWAIIGYFIAQMLLDKSFRVFKKWKGAAAVTAAFLIMFAVIAFDLTGYETRVPSVDQVKEVNVGGVTAYPWDSSSSLHDVVLTDPEDIEKVINIHEAIVSFGEDGEPMTDSLYVNYFNFTVYYTLKSGRILQRSYSTVAGDTILALAQELRDDYDVRYLSHELDVLEDFKARGGYLQEMTVYYSQTNERKICTGVYAEWLWNAVMADFEAGRIGVKSVYSGDRNDTTNLDFRWVLPISKEDQDRGGNQHYYFEFALLDSATETYRVLNELEKTGHLYYEQDMPDYMYTETEVLYD